MKHAMLTFVAFLTLASSVPAQQPTTDLSMSGYLRKSYISMTTDLMAAVEMMPAQDFEFRPAGVVKEVRTFGELVLHIAQTNSWVCSMGDGKPDGAAALAKSAGAAIALDKAKLVALISETTKHCHAYLTTLTDENLSQVITTGADPRQMQSSRGNAVIFAIAHSNEHYGNIVTYLRAKGLVPPAAASQALFLSPVPPRKP